MKHKQVKLKIFVTSVPLDFVVNNTTFSTKLNGTDVSLKDVEA